MTDLDQLIGSVTDSPALLLNLSGGKDSTRMLGLVREKFPASRRIPLWPTQASSM